MTLTKFIFIWPYQSNRVLYQLGMSELDMIYQLNYGIEYRELGNVIW